MSTAEWMLYSTVVSAFLMTGAFALESVMRNMRRPTRWCWVAALLGSLVLPAVGYFTPAHVPYTPSSLVIETVPLSVAPAASVAPAPVHHTGLILWATSSLLVLLFVVISYLRLMYARRSWTRRDVNGVEVWVSENTGPAALGVARSSIVLPRWVLSLEERALSLMMLHEREHLRAWDPRLMLAGILMAGAVPWNPFSWLMLRHLRLAVEVDCDARVLARDPDPAGYGAVLLEVGRRRATRSFAMSTFAEPRSQLELRIRRMAERPRARWALRAALMSILAVASATGAYAMRSPAHSRIVMDPPSYMKTGLVSDNAIDGVGADQAVAGHTAIANATAISAASDTVAPVLQNADDVRREINRLYPPRLRDAGIEGTTTVAVYVSTSGKVTDTKLAATSGYDLMDDAALHAAAAMVFTPAVSQGRRIGMLVMVRIPFAATVAGPQIIASDNAARRRFAVPDVIQEKSGLTPGVIRKDSFFTFADGRRKQPDMKKAPPVVIRDSIAYNKRDDGSVDTINFVRKKPMESVPRMLNVAEVKAALERAYPPALRAAGITGGPEVWMFVDTTGRVTKDIVKTSSGNDELDRAAIKVAPVMRFTPALGENGKQAVWISMNVLFSGASTANASLAPDRIKTIPDAPKRAGVPTAIKLGDIVTDVPAASASQAAAKRSVDPGEPFIVPMDVAPKLVNREEVAAAISRAYPAKLRDAGIGGKVKVWMYIDDTGIVRKTLVHTGSGIEALDDAAMSVAPILKFVAAQSHGQAIPVWVALDIVFQIH